MANNNFSLEITEDFLKLAISNISSNLIDISNLDFYEDNIFLHNYSEDNLNQLAKKIENFIKKNHISQKNVNIIIPNNISYTQIINLPKLTEKELFSAIKLQADKFIPLPIEEVNLDLETIEENKEKNTLSLLLVAASKNTIQNIKDVVELAGLIPESIENDISAISRLITNFKIANVLLDINYNSSTLFYFDYQTYLLKEIFNFEIGLNLFLKEYSMNKNKSLELTKKEICQIGINDLSIFDPIIIGLVSNINKFIAQIYNKYQFKIEKISLSNQIVNLPFLTEVLKRKIGINFEVLDIYPYLKKNNLIENEKQKLPLYISILGGNLR